MRHFTQQTTQQTVQTKLQSVQKLDPDNEAITYKVIEDRPSRAYTADISNR